MKDYREYFKGKKITVMGLGLLGRGVGDVEFLAGQGAILTVTDLRSEEELKPSLTKLKNLPTYKLINFHLGGHDLKDFNPSDDGCDMILKAAGVPLNSPFIEEARKNKISIEMSTSLFAKLSPAMIVGVTGTRGKSTVATMIYEILSKAGKKTFLGGNVRGVSTLAHLSACDAQAGLPESTSDEIAVLELDSWQLQGFGEAKISPHISVFTTFYPDHLDYYASTSFDNAQDKSLSTGEKKSLDEAMDLYLEDKSKIFEFQNENDFLILGDQCADLITKKYQNKIKGKVTTVGAQNVDYTLKVIGEHNKYNAALAKEAVKALKISDEAIKSGLEGFRGLPGRLELINEVEGVKIYNDNNSTTSEATLVALEALAPRLPSTSLGTSSSGQNQNIVLILGGSDKGSDFTELLEAIPMFCKAVILLPGTGTNNLRFKISDLRFEEKIREAGTLADAVNKAMEAAIRGDVILFSPAFASFGPPPGGFKNEFDRGEQFVDLVRKLK